MNTNYVVPVLKDFYIQRIIIYCVIAAFSLFVIIPLGDLRIRFMDATGSRCILYSTIVYTTNPKYHYFKISFGKEEVCTYSIAVSSVFCLVYPIAAGGLYYFLYRKEVLKEGDKQELSYTIFLIHVITEVAVVALVLVSACMITAGFQHLCYSIVSEESSVHSCQDAQNFMSWRGFDGSNFYVCLAVTTAGSWILFVSWLLQGVLGIWKLWKMNMLAVIPLACCKQA